ncbi:MAG: adenylyltransferase/cytidyltransferase family protein, partial [Nitrospirota bacterium]
MGSEAKIKGRADLRKTLEEKKGLGKKIVFTNGCFDILHIGHVLYLEEAKGLGDILVVAINSDSSVKKIKGAGRPIVPQD